MKALLTALPVLLALTIAGHAAAQPAPRPAPDQGIQRVAHRNSVPKEDRLGPPNEKLGRLGKTGHYDHQKLVGGRGHSHSSASAGGRSRSGGRRGGGHGRR